MAAPPCRMQALARMGKVKGGGNPQLQKPETMGNFKLCPWIEKMRHFLATLSAMAFCAAVMAATPATRPATGWGSLALHDADSLLTSPESIERQAETAFGKYEWAKAEHAYKTLIEVQIQADGLGEDEVKGSKYRSWYAKMLHRCALACLFQGKEDEGIDLLGRAADCGDYRARRQHGVLTGNSFYKNNLKIRHKDLRSFEENLMCLDFKDCPDSADAKLFWDRMTAQNANLNELKAAATRKRIPKTLRLAMDEIGGNSSLMTKALSGYSIYSPDGYDREIYQDLFAGADLVDELKVYRATVPNAFATPYGEIYLADELIYLYDFCKPMVLSVCAHETAHSLLYHSLAQVWMQERKRRSGTIWAGVALGLTLAASTTLAVLDASSGGYHSSQYWNDWGESMANLSVMLDYAIRENAYYFQFKYSRSQEIEADLMAYRYCETMGMGGYVYIIALELLGDDYGILSAGKTDDHPTIAYRVSFLKYLYAKEHPDPML